ncbi:hypothetical protein ASN_714 [Acetobacter senegalensis]|uniref:OmpA-like domain-containing protein n=2 Tax=Acetobacter senegalensis TaxID=446692 RepID=A0A0U5ER96_9PROT|nr:hypothetical protein ASN_714 [Acetobacter senegalensis]
MRSPIPPGLFSGLVLPVMQSTLLPSPRLAALCALLLLPAAGAQAQVVTNSQALDALGGAPAQQAAPATKTPQAPARPSAGHRPVAQKPVMQPPLTSAPAAPSQQTAPATAGTQSSGRTNSSSVSKTTQPAQPQTTPSTGTGTGTQGHAASPGHTSSSVPNSGQATGATTAQPAAGRTTGQSATQAGKPSNGDVPPSPTIPPAPPPEPTLTPAPPDIEIHPFPVPPQPAVDLNAKGAVTTIPGGVRLTFAPGSSALNPETHQAILAFGQRLSDKPHVRALIDVYSSGAADDPSLPRRMALARGLAARSVLMNGGTPSTRIYLRVIGVPKTPAPDGVQDYMDIYQSDAVP